MGFQAVSSSLLEKRLYLLHSPFFTGQSLLLHKLVKLLSELEITLSLIKLCLCYYSVFFQPTYLCLQFPFYPSLFCFECLSKRILLMLIEIVLDSSD